jgi:hypothetical protein
MRLKGGALDVYRTGKAILSEALKGALFAFLASGAYTSFQGRSNRCTGCRQMRRREREVCDFQFLFMSP